MADLRTRPCDKISRKSHTGAANGHLYYPGGSKTRTWVDIVKFTAYQWTTGPTSSKCFYMRYRCAAVHQFECCMYARHCYIHVVLNHRLWTPALALPANQSMVRCASTTEHAARRWHWWEILRALGLVRHARVHASDSTAARTERPQSCTRTSFSRWYQ